ncbi:acyl transferase/acyl hydrolase/lysophospholipase [Thelonectria olida]|uniref:Lysophospholipase n=1 Tax=Thelonectria olida TaxID=1576542 RepID=A0A9P9AND6_9HYPO|nr:acyl transferase/acyl hydrolase/lysophospholipase [Thelonectria olida]
MVILRALRQSPAYLYVKAYCLCALVSLFKTTPISSAISQVKTQFHHNNFRRLRTLGGPRLGQLGRHQCSLRPPGSSPCLNSGSIVDFGLSSKQHNKSRPQSRTRKILRRWHKRAVDLSEIKKLLQRDDKDFKAYPELAWDAAVRSSPSLHPEEKRFIELRKQRISSQGANSLQKFLGLPPDEVIDPRDVPLVALGGSGGGYRAMYGFAAFISACKKSHFWDCITWTAAVSGSCWTLGAYYTIACQDVSKLTRHYLSVAKEMVHPISISALNIVIRSSRGVYFLIGPLVRKAQCSIIGLGIMDLYATLITTYQFLSRQPGARLSRATFQLSKVWTRSGLNVAAEPMPIFTAVRRAPKNAVGVKANRDSSISKGQPPMRSLTQHDSNYLKLGSIIDGSAPRTAESSQGKGLFQWFEMSPLEIGCAETQRYVPTWAWGRTFVSGKSVDRKPEQSLSLLLGQCTSAPAGPLTAYISALLASIPKGTIMSRVLFAANKFASMKRWEHLWANPIRAGHDPNPFYGMGTSFVAQAHQEKDVGWDLLNFGVSELDTSRLFNLASRSKDKWLENLAHRIFTPTEWDELNRLLTGMQDPTQRKETMTRYLSIVYAIKAAAYKALRRFHAVSWEHLVVSADVFSLKHQHDEDSQDHHVSFSSRFQDEHGTSDLPKLRLNLSWSGERVTARVTAEKRSFSTQVKREDTGQDKFAEQDPPNEPWEAQGRVRLMDSGMSNNLPNHILARPERCADVIVAFDASSDVQTDSAIRRIHNFAEDCHIDLEDTTNLFEPPPRVDPVSEGTKSDESGVQSQYIDRFASVFRGTRQNGHSIYIIYCPLLPSIANPSFHPSQASFSTSYNLVWTQDQVHELFQTVESNAFDYAMHILRQVLRKVYLDKKAKRTKQTDSSP